MIQKWKPKFTVTLGIGNRTDGRHAAFPSARRANPGGATGGRTTAHGFRSGQHNLQRTPGSYRRRRRNAAHMGCKGRSSGHAMLNFKDTTLKSQSQKFALEDINKQISIIIGQGGSGKTYLSSLIMKNIYSLKEYEP